jgi:hypothetical protein
MGALQGDRGFGMAVGDFGHGQAAGAIPELNMVGNGMTLVQRFNFGAAHDSPQKI